MTTKSIRDYINLVESVQRTPEAEGDAEGLPHLSKELISHIIQQAGTEGAHAIVKSLEYGDGAAKELLQLIVNDLKQDIGLAESVKQRLDPKCWKGKHKEGTKIKGGVRVNNCVANESVSNGFNKTSTRNNNSSSELYGIKIPGEMVHPDWKEPTWSFQEVAEKLGVSPNQLRQLALSLGNFPKKLEGIKSTYGSKAYYPRSEIKRWVNATDVRNIIKSKQGMAEALTPDQMFDMIEEMVERVAAEHGVDPELIWEEFDSVDDQELFESAAWHRKAGKSKTGGLNKKGVASYRREHPGSKLQTAVTTKPSKLKKGSKAAKRRKSFCARMGGVKGPMKKPNGKPTRKALALRKWNC